MVDNVQMPLFGRAGTVSTTADWNEVDNFDVDVLAEYLLDDVGLTSGDVTFDFALDTMMKTQTMVSPENSEDGNLPPVAETSGAPAPAASTSNLNIPHPTPVVAQSSSTSAISLPQNLHQEEESLTTFPTLPNPIPNLTTKAPAAKRQKLAGKPVTVSVPMVAVSGKSGSVVLSKEQLTAAAAQAMQQGRGRKKSQAQVDRRRERNRILARRTRLRKKFFFESLQKEVMDLQKENRLLKELVKQNVDEKHSKPILDECDAMEKLPPAVNEVCGENADLDTKDFSLVKSIQMSQHSFIITDPSLPDNPVVFASDAFLKITGYSREQVLGRNCRFLQGSETDKAKVESIRKGLASGDDVSVTIMNYTADGTPFWNKLFIAALRDAQDNIVNYIGVLAKVASPPPGDPEHDKALPVVKKQAAENTVKAIEGTMTAAVAAAAAAAGL